MSEVSPLNAVDIRKVVNGYVVRFMRVSEPPIMTLQPEERVFTDWSSLVTFLQNEGFLI